MAKSQIGAVIGIEGATEFSNKMKILARETKLFNSEMKALTSTFDKNTVTLKNVNDKKQVLNKLLGTAKEKLAAQQTALEKVNKLVDDETISDEKWATQQQNLQTQINNTTAEINELEQEIKDLPNAAKLVTEAWTSATSDWGELFKGVGDTLTKYITAPLVAGAGVAVKTAIDYQSAFTGVMKTVDEEVNERTKEVTYSYQDLNAELKKIPLETASSYQSVAAVAEAAGQLGIEIRDIPKYAKNIIMLGDSTNISAEEAATSIAQFMNIVGDSTDSIDKFGGALVALGNNTATDEASILRLATRLASAGHLVGLTTPEILGLSAAMSSVGLTAEAGGTAMSQAMSKITKAVASGGETLELFGEVTGQTGEQFAETWRNEPIRALEEFLIGMSNLEGGSEELILKLDELGFSGIRESDTLRRLTSDYKGVTEAVDLATASYITNEEALNGQNALTEEASKRYETWEAQISQLKEALLQLADEIGQDLVPDLIELVNGAKDLVQKWREMNPETKQVWLNILKVAAAVGPLLSVFGSLLITVAKVKAAFSVLKGAEGVDGLTTALSGGGKTSLIGSLKNGITAIEEFCGTTGLGGLVASLGISVGAVAGFGLIMHKIFSDNWGEMREWSIEMSNDLGGLNQDWDTYGQTVSTTLDETGAYIDTYAEANSRLLQDKSSETTRKVKEDLVDLRAGVRENLDNVRDIAKYDFAQTKQSASSSSLEAKRNVTMSFNQMSGEVTLMAGNIARKVPQEFRNMTSGVTQEGEKTKQAYKMVLTGIDRMPLPDLSSSGAHMMQTLTNGINAHSGGPISAAASVARGIAAYLKFSEPERGALSDFHTAMPDMMKLMAQGINQNMYLVEDALDNVSSMMASNLEGRGNNVSYGGVVINLNVPQGTDGRTLVDQIETEIANRTMRRRMVFN